VKTRLLILIAAILAALVPLPSSVIERWYSTALYPRIQAIVTPLTNRVPFALLDAAVAILIAILVAWLAARIRREGWRRALVHFTGAVIVWAAVLYLVFLGLWGLNYRRIPLERKLDYERSRVTRAGVIDLANRSVGLANAEYAPAHAASFNHGTLAAAFASAERALGARRVAVTGVAKRSALSLYFRRAAIDGMTDPIFLEIIVNPDVLPIERPFVLAHEWAHLAGYASESEANFIAWLTCARGDALARYSGALVAYSHAVSALPRSDRAGVARLDEGPLADLRAIAARYERSSPAVRRAANEVYDKYLKANRVEEGIASYDAVLGLIVGTRFGPEGNPTLR
jgi:hypothetical protein